MKLSSRSLAFLGCLALGLVTAGCLPLNLAPAREKQIEEEFAKLAAMGPEKIAGLMNERMVPGLELTAEQKPRVEAINLDYAKQLCDLAVTDKTAWVKVNKRREQENAKEKELKAVLTPDQFTHFIGMREQLRNQLRLQGSQL